MLQKKLAGMKNIDVHLSSVVNEIKGYGRTVTSIIVTERLTNADKDYEVSGGLVQVGLTPYSQILA